MNDSRSEYTTSHFKTSYPQNFNAEIVDLSKNSKFFSRNTRPFFRVDHQVQNNPQSTVTVKDSYLRPPTPPPKENEEVSAVVKVVFGRFYAELNSGISRGVALLRLQKLLNFQKC